jgi:hypothetical protein
VDAVLLEIDSAQGLNINLAELSGVGYEESEGTVAQDKSGSDDKMQKRSSEAWGLSWWRRGLAREIVMASRF